MKLPVFEVEQFRVAAKDPEGWRAKARELRHAAETLWGSFEQCLVPGGGQFLSESARQIAIDHFVEKIYVSHFLYGFTMECALKYDIIRKNPDSVEFKPTRSGHGLEMVSIGGVKLSSGGHDLVKLADAAGIWMTHELNADEKVLKHILEYLSVCILWQGRYPVPKHTLSGSVKVMESPGQAFGLYLRDWVDPMLDRIIEASNFETGGVG